LNIYPLFKKAISENNFVGKCSKLSVIEASNLQKVNPKFTEPIFGIN